MLLIFTLKGADTGGGSRSAFVDEKTPFMPRNLCFARWNHALSVVFICA